MKKLFVKIRVEFPIIVFEKRCKDCGRDFNTRRLFETKCKPCLFIAMKIP